MRFDSDEQLMAEQQLYYELDPEMNPFLLPETSGWQRRNERMFNDESYMSNFVIDLPVGKHSANWYLVTNDDIGE